jgi:hypothetical protein
VTTAARTLAAQARGPSAGVASDGGGGRWVCVRREGCRFFAGAAVLLATVVGLGGGCGAAAGAQPSMSDVATTSAASVLAITATLVAEFRGIGQRSAGKYASLQAHRLLNICLGQ